MKQTSCALFFLYFFSDKTKETGVEATKAVILWLYYGWLVCVSFRMCLVMHVPGPALWILVDFCPWLK